MPVAASKSWRVFLSPFSATSMYSGQLETIRRLLEADRSGTVHFAGSCLADGVSKRGRTARLPIPKAATPAPLRKVRLLAPPPKCPDVLPTTRSASHVRTSPCHPTGFPTRDSVVTTREVHGTVASAAILTRFLASARAVTLAMRVA